TRFSRDWSSDVCSSDLGGALLSVILVFVIAQVDGRISIIRLLLAGIAISVVLSALTSFIVMTAQHEEAIRSALFWMMGSLAGAKIGRASCRGSGWGGAG